MDTCDQGTGRQPTPMVSYPHMQYQDASVWSVFLTNPPWPIQEVWYDVKVGEPIPTPPTATAADKRLAEGTGCKRIDAVFRSYGVWAIVEVKPYGNHVALGQALLYLDLWRERYGHGKESRALIVCESCDPDLPRIAQARGVLVWTADQSSGAAALTAAR